MTAFKNYDEAVSNVIELYRGKYYSEQVLTALKELLVKKINDNLHYDELAIYFDARLQTYGIHYDSANVYLLMMNALLSFSEYYNKE